MRRDRLAGGADRGLRHVLWCADGELWRIFGAARPANGVCGAEDADLGCWPCSLSVAVFDVLNSLAGLRGDFAAAVRAVAATQAALAVILASLAPFTLLWYASLEHYQAAIFFNALMFTVASVSAQVVLRAHYEPLIRRNANHVWMLRAWLLVYAFVGIQMGWVLRPFIGDPASPVQFFRPDSWGNAYVIVARMLWRLLLAG